jgi:ABC-type nitrate/sulfonate/bicarbonate transport system permease component
MKRQQLSFHLPELYAAILLTGVVGYAINVSLRATERRVVFWVGEERTEAW